MCVCVCVCVCEGGGGVNCRFLSLVHQNPHLLLTIANFPRFKVVTFDASFHHTVRQWVEIVGSQATLRMDDFVIPASCDEA
jgi:hypothetical protein